MLNPCEMWGYCDSYLFLSKVKLAQLLPQMPVLAKHAQSGCGLSQIDDVRGIRKLVQDVVLHVQR